MAQTTELVARQPSQRLHNAVIDIISHFGKLKDKVAYAIAIGQEEGWTPVQTGDLIRKELLAAGYHRNTAARVLPPEAKALPRGSTSTSTSTSTNTVSNILVQNPSLLQPADYQTEDLPKYTKQFLIQVIHYLEKRQVRNPTSNHPKTQTISSSSSSSKPKQKTVTPVTTTNTTRRSAEDISSNTSEVLRLSQAGKSQREISRLTGVSKTSIVRILAKNK